MDPTIQDLSSTIEKNAPRNTCNKKLILIEDEARIVDDVM